MAGAEGHRRRRGRVGLAVGADAVCAVHLAGSRVSDAVVWRRPLALPAGFSAGGDVAWASAEPPEAALAEALATLRADVGGHAGVVDVALLPPLVQLRRIELPGLRVQELRHVLARDARGYFFGARAAQVVAARRQAVAARGQGSVLATAASVEVVEAVTRAAAVAGWRVAMIGPAYDAWAAGATALWPALRPGAGRVALLFADRVEILGLDRARPVVLRRLRAGADVGEIAAAGRSPTMGADGGDAAPDLLALVGPAARRQAFGDALRATGEGGTGTAPLPALRSVLGDDPAALAAAFAGRARDLELVPPSVAAARARVARHATRALGAAAVLLAVAAVATERWGVERELDAVAVRRRALGPAVQVAMRDREQLGALRAQLGALTDAARGATRWSAAVATVAARLPDDAYLVAFRGSADSVVLNGVAARAADVFEAVERAPGVAGVRSEAPVRQEAQADGTSAERFSLAARLTGDAGAVRPADTTRPR